MRNLVDHKPIHDKNYTNPCLEVRKLQNLGFLWIETYFLLKKKCLIIIGLFMSTFDRKYVTHV